MKAVIYARVSSDEQADRGLSIPTQIKICREYINREGWTFIKEYVDEAISGLKSDRPSFLEMLSDAQEGKFDVIVVYSFSRFSRNRFDAITKKKLLRDIGVQVISATEPIDSSTPEGKLLEGIIESINEFYSANLSRETFRGLKANAEMGFWNGGVPPLGYRRKEIIVNGLKKSSYEIDEKEARIVRKIFKLAYEGVGVKKICLILNEEGFRTRRGKLFTPSTVRGILKNEAYIGNLVWNKQDKKRKGVKYKDKKFWIRRENVFPKIIKKEIFEHIQRIFEKNRKRHAPKSVARTHTLSGILKCGLCGANYIYQTSTKRRGEKFYENGYYKCATKQKLGSKYCDNVVLKSELIEPAIIEIVLEKIYSEENIKKIFELYKKEHDLKSKERKEHRKLLNSELNEVRKKINNILTAIENGFSEEILKERLNELKKRGSELNLSISKLDRNYEFNYTFKDVKKFAEEIRGLIHSLESRKINKILKIFINKILVYPDRLEILYTFNFKKNTFDNGVTLEGANSYLSNEDSLVNGLSFEGKNFSSSNNCRGYDWCRGTESNRRHEDFQSSALPTELPRHLIWWAREESNL